MKLITVYFTSESELLLVFIKDSINFKIVNKNLNNLHMILFIKTQGKQAETHLFIFRLIVKIMPYSITYYPLYPE